MTSRNPKAVRKYLERHAEPEVREVERLGRRTPAFGHALCIPAYGEHDSLFQTLDAVPTGPAGDNLIVLVVNETVDAPEWVRQSNGHALARLRRELGPALRSATHMECFRHPTGELWLLDRTASGNPLPQGQGVGLARKIASDVALALDSAGGLISPWLHCTDADALLPGDYFERSAALDPLAGTAPTALLYDFRHSRMSDPDIDRAALRYEIFLRYYVLGLHAAGSPWAHQSLGSTLALAPVAYAQVRGFPKRRAAEDFHLLAKLAKLGPLLPMRGAPIHLSGRPSTRVPFGTGVGVARELERIAAGEPYPVYDPQVFRGIESWLACLRELATPLSGSRAHDESSIRRALERHAKRCDFAHGDLLWKLLAEGGEAEHAIRASAQGIRRLHEGFDALRTLRLIHRLRDGALPSRPLIEALETAPFLDAPLPNDLAALGCHMHELEARRLPGPGPVPESGTK